ncbi:MAG: hypothetical protein AAFP04_12660 [Myxococcota bacterium]
MGPLINIFKCAVASLVLAAASPAFAGVVVCLDGPPPGTNGYDDTSGCASAINFYSSVGCEAIHSDDNANGQAVDEFDTLAVSCFNALGEPVDEPPLPPTFLPRRSVVHWGGRTATREEWWEARVARRLALQAR